jgi:hypothetical protein
MNADLKTGDVINAPNGPFWPRGDRARISQGMTALANAEVHYGAKAAFHLSGRKLILELPIKALQDPTPATDSSAVKMFTVTGRGDEYLTGTFGGINVPVYKPAHFRPSIYTDQNWNGRLKSDGLHTYTQTGLETRIDGMALGGRNVTWDEVIWPPYFDGDIIEAAYVENQYPKAVNGSDKYVWVDLNVAGRQWGWIDTICYQTAIGSPPVARKIVSVGSKPY